MIKKVLASFITAFAVVIVFASTNFGYDAKGYINYSEETLSQQLNDFEIITPSPSPTPTEKVIERREMLKRGNLMNEIEYVTPIVNLVEVEEEPEEEYYEEPVDLGNIFDEELTKVPYNHLQFLYDDGWTFDLTDEDFGSLSPDQMKSFEEKFHSPEVFVRMGRGIMAVPLPDEKVEKPQDKKLDAPELKPHKKVKEEAL